MNTVRLRNEYGETIQVKRGRDGGVLVSHSDIAPEGVFGRFLDVGIILQGQPLIGAFIVLDGESFLLNADEAAMIREAAGRLAEPRHRRVAPNGKGVGDDCS